MSYWFSAGVLFIVLSLFIYDFVAIRRIRNMRKWHLNMWEDTDDLIAAKKLFEIMERYSKIQSLTLVFPKLICMIFGILFLKNPRPTNYSGFLLFILGLFTAALFFLLFAQITTFLINGFQTKLERRIKEELKSYKNMGLVMYDLKSWEPEFMDLFFEIDPYCDLSTGCR